MTNQVNNQSLIPSADVIQLTLTLKITTAQVVETSVTVDNNSPIQDFVHPDDHTQPTCCFCNPKPPVIDVVTHAIGGKGLDPLFTPGLRGLSKQLT